MTKTTQTESNDFKLLNYEMHRTGHLFYEKLFEKWIRAIPKEFLINELKRRKLLKFDFIKKKYREIE